ncbi:DUF177 domain-containing protein [Psychrobacter arenosus]|uniref:YceD family protein n=1 Tax=Psychrobacter arenosus TaxID=256326 RepID=UPI00191A37E8|nr:YceD family protein [Psychrobacter arenosus]
MPQQNESVTPATAETAVTAKDGISTQLPQRVSLDKWADIGFNWQGEMMPADFERLQAMLSDEQEQTAIKITAALARSSNVLSLNFDLIGSVWLTCQRCLQPVNVELTGTHNIALLEDEGQIGLLDEDDDHLLLEEVAFKDGHDTYLPLERLIEDEILLKIPLSPKHDDCEMEVEQVGEIEEFEEESPFAALAALKGKL